MVLQFSDQENANLSTTFILLADRKLISKGDFLLTHWAGVSVFKPLVDAGWMEKMFTSWNKRGGFVLIIQANSANFIRVIVDRFDFKSLFTVLEVHIFYKIARVVERNIHSPIVSHE